jgi:hypothetical protein
MEYTSENKQSNNIQKELHSVIIYTRFKQKKKLRYLADEFENDEK